jgi:hypothetical protein
VGGTLAGLLALRAGSPFREPGRTSSEHGSWGARARIEPGLRAAHRLRRRGRVPPARLGLRSGEAPAKLSRISPLANAKQKFGRTGLFEFAKSAVKLIVISRCLGVFLTSAVSGHDHADPATDPVQVSGMMLEKATISS